MSFDYGISEWKQRQNLEAENRRMQERVKASFESGFQEGFKAGYEKRKSEETEKGSYDKEKET